MEITPMPGCCAAVVVHGLRNLRPDVDGAKELMDCLLDDNPNHHGATFEHMKVLVATTTQYQTDAAIALERFGFYRSKQAFTNERHWHPDNVVTLWYARTQRVIAKLEKIINAD